MTNPSIIIDGTPIEFSPGENLLCSMLKAGIHPTAGGCLCCQGDCPHCVATVDGVSYVRTCQVASRAGIRVERHHRAGNCPPLPLDERAGPVANVRNLHCDVVVIGQGEAGQAESEKAESQRRSVIALDAGLGQEVIGIYPGPLVVARSRQAMLHVRAREEVVVATGAAEIQPVVPGNHLEGLVTARAATSLAEAGIALGKVAAVGTPPQGIGVIQLQGELMRFEGTDKVEAVVMLNSDGQEERTECDSVCVGLGLYPRDALARMARGGGSSMSTNTAEQLAVRLVGDAAGPADVPPSPRSGTVCPCAAVTVDDLEFVWSRGFQELELVKRATLAGTGTCQGTACLPHLRSFLAAKGEEVPPPFTARPVTRQITIGEISAGAYHQSTARTALHDEHLRLGAQMERMGGWWRPWNYGKWIDEYWAIREGVSICDVSTLGKMQMSGPDALELLERLYPTNVESIRLGRSRYVLNLNEQGYVLDDGLICKEEENRYLLTFTTGGATTAELWIRDWAESWNLDVRLINQTMSLSAISITGPLAHQVLTRAGMTQPIKYMQHANAEVAGIPCKVFRLSFTGEVSYELHHASEHSVELWRRLLELGSDLGIKPHGIDAMLRCRLEKGHIIVGQDTDYDSTPRRINHEWAIKLDKPTDFVGRQAVMRTNRVELDRQLAGFEMAGDAPHEGAVIWHNGEYAGYVTSSTSSPILKKSVMLGWLNVVNGELPDKVMIDGRPAQRTELPFYDPTGARAKAASLPNHVDHGTPIPSEDIRKMQMPTVGQRLDIILGTRIVAQPDALDGATWPDDVTVLRFAPDEIFILGKAPSNVVNDPHALIVEESGYAGIWLNSDSADRFLTAACEWARPDERPAFSQGRVAGLPVKLWLEEARTLFLVPAPFAADLQMRMESWA